VVRPSPNAEDFYLMNRTESCYQKPSRMATLHSPKESGKPISYPARVRMADGSEKTITRREYKQWRKSRKADRA
jgi:hypothetical protein